MKLKYFELAKKLSKNSDHRQHRLSAVVVKKNRILGKGWNQNKTHVKSPHSWFHIHAELSAVLGITKQDLKGSTIYVYREGKMGQLKLAKPCESCYNLIRSLSLKSVCFSIDDGYLEEFL